MFIEALALRFAIVQRLSSYLRMVLWVSEFLQPAVVKNAAYIGGGRMQRNAANASAAGANTYKTPQSIDAALYLAPVATRRNNAPAGTDVVYDLGSSSGEPIDSIHETTGATNLYDAASGSAAAFYDTAGAGVEEEHYGFGFHDETASNAGPMKSSSGMTEQPMYDMGTMNGASGSEQSMYDMGTMNGASGSEQPMYDMGTMDGASGVEQPMYDVAGTGFSDFTEDAALYDMANSGHVADISSGYLQVGVDVDEDEMYDMASGSKLDTEMVRKGAHIYDLSVPLRKVEA